MKTIKLLFITILLLTGSSFSQSGSENELVKIKTFQSFDQVYPGTELKIAVEVDIAEEWHINSDSPNEEYLIPTKISVLDSINFQPIGSYYPKAENLTFSFSETPLSVFEGNNLFGILLKVNENLQPGKYPLIVTVEYQACNDITCLPPAEVSDTLIISVVDNKSVINEINGEVFKNIKLNYTEVTTESRKNNEDNSIASLLDESGLLLGLIFIFIGGLALNLTPCVYPLIPITIGYFGGQSEGSTGRLITMGLLFVIGMAVTYSVVGVVTSLSGAVFGSLLQNPVVIIFIVFIFIALSLSMFGLYEFKMPDSLVSKAGGAKSGYYGAFFMGLTMGIVAAPCIGPFVLGLVTYVAAKGDPLFGFIVFFVLAIGLGFPYLFLAIFSGKIKKLPKAGEWMDAVKHIFGFILLGMALYFLLPLLPDSLSGYILPVFMIITAVYLLFFDKLANKILGFRIFKIVFSLIILAIAVYAIIPSTNEGMVWEEFQNTKLSNAIGNSPVIIDFYADWCIPCKELDALTFSDPQVIQRTEGFLKLKADMTKSVSTEVERLREQFKIVGVPTVLILNSDGKEIKRITGFVDAKEFLSYLEDIK
ncbi:MAG: protein-disulfide reductase DsbD [Ignavibacteriaceae bacterium]